jgi:hypothetical protein
MTEKGDAMCPTPRKSRFATMEMAAPAARRASLSLGKNLYPYENCPCGWIHLTSREDGGRNEPLLNGGPVDEALFALVVRDDVVNRCAISDAEALRDPKNLDRWKDALWVFWIDTEAQLAKRAGIRDKETMEWRKRVKLTQNAIRVRRAEVRQLLRERAEQQRAVAAANNTPIMKARRRSAGERAVQRLKDAHPDEFMTYLAEEYVAEGLPMGGKLAEYAPGGVSE